MLCPWPPHPPILGATTCGSGLAQIPARRPTRARLCTAQADIEEAASIERLFLLIKDAADVRLRALEQEVEG